MIRRILARVKRLTKASNGRPLLSRRVRRVFEGLDDERIRRLKALAELRGDSLESTVMHVVRRVGLYQVPKKIRPFALPKDLEFEWIRDEGTHHATIKLKNGRILTGYRTSARFHKFYDCFSDLLPKEVSVDTYEVYTDALRRYQDCVGAGVKRLLPPGNGGVFVDAGAYFGFKAIGFLDYLGKDGRVVMIEMGEENEALAVRTFRKTALKTESSHSGAQSGKRTERWRTAGGTAPRTR